MKELRNRIMILTTDEQLYNAAQSEISVTIYIDEEAEYTGRIIEYSNGAIRTTDGFYLRENCIVKTSENYFLAL